MCPLILLMLKPQLHQVGWCEFWCSTQQLCYRRFWCSAVRQQQLARHCTMLGPRMHAFGLGFRVYPHDWTTPSAAHNRIRYRGGSQSDPKRKLKRTWTEQTVKTMIRCKETHKMKEKQNRYSSKKRMIRKLNFPYTTKRHATMRAKAITPLQSFSERSLSDFMLTESFWFCSKLVSLRASRCQTHCILSQSLKQLHRKTDFNNATQNER